MVPVIFKWTAINENGVIIYSLSCQAIRLSFILATQIIFLMKCEISVPPLKVLRSEVQYNHKYFNEMWEPFAELIKQDVLNHTVDSFI